MRKTPECLVTHEPVRKLHHTSIPPTWATHGRTPGARYWLLALLLGVSAACPVRAEEDHPHGDHAKATAGGEAHDEHEDHEEAENHGSEAVSIGADVLKEFEIRLAVAGPGRIASSVALPAEVRANGDRLAHITPRFAGIVKSVKKTIGDRVEPGEVLAVIEGSDSLAPYSLKTEIAGVVIAKHITRGEPVTRESQAFVIADLDNVWIDISAYQKDFADLRIGQQVLVSAGHGREEAEGPISYISPIVDEETRTATARVVLPNPDRVWRPGMFVTARVLIKDTKVSVAVPRTAVEMVEGQMVVFVETDEGFALRPIKTGHENALHVEVVSGLRPGERYVAQGGFTLKAELAREELSGGHSH